MKYGHFDTAVDEYVIERPDVPVSWTNYLGSKNLCTVLSHNGGGYSYYKSSQQGRITRFRPNSVPLDRPGHYVYLRDDADGDFWSVSWQPVGKPLEGEGAASYTTRHGLGYSTFEASYKGIDASQTIFIPVDDDVEIWDTTVTNASDVERTLTVGSYVEFSFHTITIDNQNLQMSLYSSGTSYEDGIIEYDFYYEPWTYHFFASSEEPSSYDSLRENFIGPYRDEANPIAIERGEGSNTSATTQNHCGALLHKVTLAPGESKRLVFMLGYGSRDVAGRAMKAKYSIPANVDAERARLRAFWRAKQDKLQIRTPHEGMNTMINSWTLLQAETCVQWSRFASFVEVGGRAGLGYRDTAQDVMSVIHSNPTKTLQRIVELLRAQVSSGYGLHLFDPEAFNPDAEPLPDVPSPTIVPRGNAADLIHGLEDTCSDDHLWLVPSVVEYVKETGDLAFLDRVIPFADGPEATVYEHLVAALDFSSKQIGANGVALGLRADWNDCLNLGGGETSLVTFLHAWAIGAFLEIARPLGRTADVERFEAERERIAKVADTQLWDGEWWIRGYTRDGVKIGSKENEEGKIFLEHQAWPVIAGITSQERGITSMNSVTKLLGSEYGSHLNWPAFTKVDDTVGFVTRVYPGIKENAAIFSHPNAWPIIAEALLGRGDEAVALYDAILPYNQNENIEVRGAEPYAYVQFIYGRDHEWFGKAQNPWLTGTAGWMYTAATKYILGVRLTLDGLVVSPSIPKDWDGFEVTRQWRDATYEIVVTNPNHVSSGVASITVDGVDLDPTAAIPAAPAGSVVKVEVVLG
ncbi:N,N'-diacetylchitobiose phosphorylase [Flavimobilis sp. GY10621]|uniref:N,N'-diacetylchitobiose phosphorylase n=1 Tax=Flavimobilis rhizosphaerae TaxID=2775421 RepID=A0ABR9DT47_9MICO|nr:N,N'-diacetylchitobiose phosphorylase [Flavimobilis rhizosphaerae]MBD9700198.1 N,N'-diacetylchitobiose phosphorylase [Flavimobilis rhizosphaerae]